MDELLRFLQQQGGQSDTLPVWEALLAILVSAVCASLICQVYRLTHRETAYSPSYARTLLMISMVTTLIMVVIGSNIARAFSLVGALSIIRFRNAVKETRDVGFIFFSMAIAMAAGTRFYLLACSATALICIVILLADHFDFGGRTRERERLLKVRLDSGADPVVILEPVFKTLFDHWALVLLETAKQGLAVDAVFSVRRKDSVSAAEVLNKIQEIEGNPKVSYHLGLEASEL